MSCHYPIQLNEKKDKHPSFIILLLLLLFFCYKKDKRVSPCWCCCHLLLRSGIYTLNGLSHLSFPLILFLADWHNYSCCPSFVVFRILTHFGKPREDNNAWGEPVFFFFFGGIAAFDTLIISLRKALYIELKKREFFFFFFKFNLSLYISFIFLLSLISSNGQLGVDYFNRSCANNLSALGPACEPIVIFV